MFGTKKKTGLDVNQIVGTAMTAFMEPNGRESDASSNHRESNGRNGMGSVGAVVLGAALAVSARAAYLRARQKLDFERVADAVEQRLSD